MTYEQIIENMARAANPALDWDNKDTDNQAERKMLKGHAIKKAKAAFKAIEDAGCVVVDPKNIEIGSIDKSIFNELVQAGKIGGA